MEELVEVATNVTVALEGVTVRVKVVTVMTVGWNDKVKDAVEVGTLFGFFVVMRVMHAVWEYVETLALARRGNAAVRTATNEAAFMMAENER